MLAAVLSLRVGTLQGRNHGRTTSIKCTNFIVREIHQLFYTMSLSDEKDELRRRTELLYAREDNNQSAAARLLGRE